VPRKKLPPVRPRSTAPRPRTVVAVLACVVAGGYLATSVLLPPRPTPTRATEAVVLELRKAVESWRGKHGANECPTVQALTDDGELDSATSAMDPWKTPFRITCTADATKVTSFGPDKTQSDDDIVSRSDAEGDELQAGAQMDRGDRRME